MAINSIIPTLPGFQLDKETAAYIVEMVGGGTDPTAVAKASGVPLRAVMVHLHSTEGGRDALERCTEMRRRNISAAAMTWLERAVPHLGSLACGEALDASGQPAPVKHRDSIAAYRALADTAGLGGANGTQVTVNISQNDAFQDRLRQIRAGRVVDIESEPNE